MSKFSIPLQWMAIEWPRPYDINDVWELLSHLATLSPHCPLVWEVRGTGGQVCYRIGARAHQLEKIKKSCTPTETSISGTFPTKSAKASPSPVP